MSSKDLHIKELISKFYSGQLNRAERSELKRACQSNPNYLAWLRSARYVVPSEDFYLNNAWQAFEYRRATQSVKKTISIPVWKRVSVAASVILLLGLSLLGWYSYQNTTVLLQCKTQQSQLFYLPDSTVVRLNSASTLSYKPHKYKDNRTVLLVGQGHFDVESDLSHPFTVQTSDYNVEVTGTVFEVRNYTEDQKSFVRLFEGKVQVMQEQKRFDLMPGQEWRLNKSIAKTQLHELQDDEVELWYNDELLFSEETLAEICQRLERKFETKIEIRNKGLRKVIFNARFNNGESLEQILDAFQFIYPFEVINHKDRIVIE